MEDHPLRRISAKVPCDRTELEKCISELAQYAASWGKADEKCAGEANDRSTDRERMRRLRLQLDKLEFNLGGIASGRICGWGVSRKKNIECSWITVTFSQERLELAGRGDLFNLQSYLQIMMPTQAFRSTSSHDMSGRMWAKMSASDSFDRFRCHNTWRKLPKLTPSHVKARRKSGCFVFVFRFRRLQTMVDGQKGPSQRSGAALDSSAIVEQGRKAGAGVCSSGSSAGRHCAPRSQGMSMMSMMPSVAKWRSNNRRNQLVWPRNFNFMPVMNGTRILSQSHREKRI